MTRSQHDAEMLRILLNYPCHVLLENFQPAPLPTTIQSFLHGATRHQLQTLLIEIIHRLPKAEKN